MGVNPYLLIPLCVKPQQRHVCGRLFVGSQAQSHFQHTTMPVLRWSHPPCDAFEHVQAMVTPLRLVVSGWPDRPV